jgi:hypothetical protein
VIPLSRKRLILRIAFASCILFASVFEMPLAQRPMPQLIHKWVQSGYLDFAEGTLVDGGADDYVSADGAIRLINRWDLNGDGNIDLVLPSSHDLDFAVNSYVYWGGNSNHLQQRTALPGDGATGGTIADLNKDGIPDIIISNGFNDTKTELSSFIYWGTKSGYLATDRTSLPTMDANSVTSADLNDDGYPDLIFASGGWGYQFNEAGGDLTFLRPYSDVYWGSRQGYTPQNVSHLPTFDATDVKVADVNKDGYPDILFAMAGYKGEHSGVFIYWGSPQHTYSPSRRTFLPGFGTTAVAVADLNKDGYPDIVLANDGKLNREFQGPVNYPVPSYIYWGGPDGYSPSKRTELPTEGASDVKIGDLNGDGVPDIVFTNEVGDSAFIYWGRLHSDREYQPYRRTELPTLNASRCAIADINGDGRPDLIFANNHDDLTYGVKSFVYLNSRSGFHQTQRLEFPTLGAVDVKVADLKRDGHPDIFFVNGMDGTVSKTTNSYIYWGNSKGSFSTAARQTLPISATSYTAADLNNDGYTDLILSATKGLTILWGSRNGFSLANSTTLPTHYVFNACVADFNRDGYLDLAVTDWTPSENQGRVVIFWGGPKGFETSNRSSLSFPGIRTAAVADLDGNGYPDILVLGTKDQAAIFWNGPRGFDSDRKTILPTNEAISAQIADLNGDGYLDIVIPNLYDYARLQYPKNPAIPVAAQTAPFESNTFIYWGGPKGYSTKKRSILPTVGGEDVAIADLNRDGYLDLVISSYHAGNYRDHPSYIFWGSKKGFDPVHVTLLPTLSASLVQIADFKKDGWQDIFFANHISASNHQTDSYLYWGGKDGFSPARRLSLPGVGVHGLTRADIGNIKDRSDGYDFISSAFDAGEGARFRSITWESETPGTSAVKFQVRAASNRQGLEKAAWSGPKGEHSFFTKSGESLNLPKIFRYLQYKATLVSPFGVYLPVLKRVTVDYTKPEALQQ